MVESQSPKPRPWGWIVVIGLLVVALIAIPLIVTSTKDSPKEWLDDHYTHVSGSDPDDETVVYRSEDSALDTALDIDHGTDADERRQDGDVHYLRYDSDWMVVVTPDGTGSRIELDEFDRGYRTHGTSVFFWSSHYGRGGGGFFRGGGSGSGK